MKVKQLIEILGGLDPDAEVLIMSQQSWPFEHAIKGVVVRQDVEDNEDVDAEDRAWLPRENGSAASDVFIVEGPQLRYGNKAAWAAVEGDRR